MRRRPVALLLALVLAALVSSAAGGGAQAATRCPASFTVLHDDSVGNVKIPAGAYDLRTTRLSCVNAAALLSRFLDDFDGRLPGGWVTARTGRGFTNGSTGSSFSLVPAGPAPPPSGGRCPGTFTVEHNDRIGALSLPAGRYAITARGLSCGAAANRFAFFLFHDFAGTLPAGWRMNVAQQRFTRGSSSFTVKRVSRRSGGGGGVHPNLAITCPGTVRLASGTSIGSLVLPAGRYYVNVFSDLGCQAAKRRFARFAARGALPSQWTLQADTATFLRGNEGFQVEPTA
jgi:hypothetical protein